MPLSIWYFARFLTPTGQVRPSMALTGASASFVSRSSPVNSPASSGRPQLPTSSMAVAGGPSGTARHSPMVAKQQQQTTVAIAAGRGSVDHCTSSICYAVEVCEISHNFDFVI